MQHRFGAQADGQKAYQIKSFKHDGHLHRVWLENWRVPESRLLREHAEEGMLVFINSQTRIRESDGKEWTSRIPGVSFFVPDKWYNIVALLEEQGVRYYCNIASPPLMYDNTLTYIDYDLDVIKLPNGSWQVVDEEEYQRHKKLYHYSAAVEQKVQSGLEELLARVQDGGAPFQDEAVRTYYASWKKSMGSRGPR